MIRLEVFDKSLILGANFYQLYGGSCYEKLHVGHSEVVVSIFSFVNKRSLSCLQIFNANI